MELINLMERMVFWNYIGELFLFRWLFGKPQHSENNHNPVRKSSDFNWESSNSYGSNKYDWSRQSYNDFHEEQDDYDMMDDF